MWLRKYLMSRDSYPGDSPSPIAIIYRSELDYVSRCILDCKNIETGGQLFGFWTSAGIPVVLYAIGPGRGANHQETFFNQDLSYLLNVGNFVLEKYGLQHIGEWHSHHQLGLAQPSDHDASTMVHNIEKLHLRRFLLCIGNCDNTRSTFNAFNFHEDHGYDYVHARWCVKKCESPFRPLIDQDLKHLLIHPETSSPCHGNVFGVEAAISSDAMVSFDENYWMNKSENKKVLADIYKLLKNQECVEKVDVRLDEKRRVLVTVKKDLTRETLLFPEEFPKTSVEIKIDGVAAGDESLWNYQGDILDAFSRYYVAATRPSEKKTDEEEKCLPIL